MPNSVWLAQVSRFLQEPFGGVAMMLICCSDSENGSTCQRARQDEAHDSVSTIYCASQHCFSGKDQDSGTLKNV